MKKTTKNDVIFYVWLILLGLGIFIAFATGTLLVEDNKDAALPSVVPTTPAATSGSTMPPTSDVVAVSYELPRQANYSLNQKIAWEINIGGSGVDIAIGAIALDDIYVYGNTSSNDVDFSLSNGQDVFVARLSQDGLLKKTVVFGAYGTDEIVCAYPFYDTVNGIIVVVKSLEDGKLSVYKLPLDLSVAISAEVSSESEL